LEVLKVAIPSTAESLVMSVLSIIMNSLLVIVAGTTAVAVYTSGWRIVSLAIIPHIGLGTALLTVAGAAYGAKNYKKLSIAYDYVIKLGLLMSVLMAIIIYIFAPQLTLVFSYSAESASLGPELTSFLKVISLYVLTLPLGVIASSTFQGLGKGFSALTITFVRQIFGTVTVAYILGIILNFGEVGVWWGTVLGGGLGCILGSLWVKLYIRSLNRISIKK
jgi:Na+-driven multidrug efflux pump